MNQQDVEFTNAELARKVRELDELHKDQCAPAMAEAMAPWEDELSSERSVQESHWRTSRRTFLLGLGAAASGAVLAACSTSKPSPKKPVTPTQMKAAPSSLSTDLKVAALAASLENLAVYAYTAGINAAKAGKLGSVPPAVVTFAVTARSQHEEHGAAWNAILASAGKPKVTVTDPVLTPVVNKDFAKVTNVVGLAKLALELEDIAAQTYQVGSTVVSGSHAIETAATIEPVEMQHVAILHFVLGQYPVPKAFSPTSLARPVSDIGTTL